MKNPVELIIQKRNGQELSRQELTEFIQGYLADTIPEYQMAAMLMAIFHKNMTPREIQTLTEVYINSGDRISFEPHLHTVDKHSTGGVGDKISIMLAPIVAACGGVIPMISGRGLGHTGGTLDKLESIPGLRTDYTEAQFRAIIEQVGFSIISQSDKLVPADRRIYALRDVTGTVESHPLITASIMSKKIAEGAQNLVIDLKVGTGAFMKTLEDAEKLGALLKAVGNQLGQKVSVVYTSMNAPLGNYVGNALEIKECIEYLQGKVYPDIHEITSALASEMLLMTGLAADEATAMQKIEHAISSGAALHKLQEFIAAQDGNPGVCDNVTILPQAKYQIPIHAQQTGWIHAVNSQSIGYALIEIGAGRRTLQSPLNYAAGAYLPLKIGDSTQKGETIGTVYTDDLAAGEAVAKKISQSYQVDNLPKNREVMIIKRLKD
jgi:pyrimidine-nucleoside phosphorylase